MGVGLGVAGCSRDHSASAPREASALLVRVGGDWQRAPGLARLADPLAIRVIDPVTLAPLANVDVHFRIQAGQYTGARLSDTLAMTDRDGVARTELTLGPAAIDTVVVGVSVAGAAPEHFTELVSPVPAVRRVMPDTVHGGDTVTVFGVGLGIAASPGAIRFAGTPGRILTLSDTSIVAVVPPCLAPGDVAVTVTNGGAQSEFAFAHNVLRGAPVALAPMAGVVLRAAQLSDCVVLSGGGARYLVVAQVENSTSTPDFLDVEVGAGGTTAPVAIALSRAQATPHQTRASAFERMLRVRETSLAALGPPPSAAVRAARPLPSAGAIDSFQMIANLDATSFLTVTARLRFVGQHILVWADTASAAALPDSTLLPLAQLFDNELFQLDEDNFGDVSDVDGNGRVHVLLTPVVNALTPATECSLSGFVSGFFSAYDLYPTAPHSNGAEIFYGFVPDSLGHSGCKHTTSEFSSVIRTTFVHELQHMINYQQHVFRRGGHEEEIWLNEGMSHMAEELASKVYERRYPAPSGRASPDQLFPDSAENFIQYNLINAFLFLNQPWANSVTHFDQGGTIEERGGAWLFLRWLADQYGEDILRRLVQTPLTGKANIEDKTGESFAQLFGDFSLAVYTDSIPGVPRAAVPPQWRFRSRNWRVIFQRLNVINNFASFPIVPLAVPYGGVADGPLRVGGMVMLTVDVPPGATSTTLRFVPGGGGAWPAGQAPQVSIFRLQ